MKRKTIWIVAVVTIALGIVGKKILGAENSFQLDADKARLEHVVYWSGLIEEYHNKTGHYPYQDMAIQIKDKPAVLVRIMTTQQRSYMFKSGSHYRSDLDNNADEAFKEVPVKDFVAEIESKLGHHVKEYYDIQKVPTKSVVGYNYFVTSSGYLLWGTCISCGVTQISTLLMDGFTPTVNIVSDGMKGKVIKAMTREEMIKHPIFLNWQARQFHKEGFVRSRESETIADSKK